MKKFFAFLFTVLLYACGGDSIPPPPEYSTTQQDTITSPTIQPQSEYENNSTIKGATIVINEEIKLQEKFKPLYEIRTDGKSYPCSTIFEFDNNGLKVTYHNDNYQLSDIFTLKEGSFIRKDMQTLIGTTNTGIPVEIKLSSGGGIQSIKFNKYNYTTVECKDTTTFTSKNSSSKLKFLDANQVEIQAGQNVRWILQQYNEENSSNITLDEIRKLNPKLNLSKVHPGQVITLY